MNARALVISVLFLGILVPGCRNKSAPNPKHVRQGGIMSIDGEILDAVLSDLIGNRDFNPDRGGNGAKKSEIVLDDKTFGGMSNHLLHNASCNPCKEVPLEIRDDLVRRNPKGTQWSLALYHPARSNVRVRDLSGIDQVLEFGQAFPDAVCFVNPYLPGYSSDKRTALFACHVGPTPHGAMGYYLLKKVHGRWEIVWRFIGYFD